MKAMFFCAAYCVLGLANAHDGADPEELLAMYYGGLTVCVEKDSANATQYRQQQLKFQKDYPEFLGGVKAKKLIKQVYAEAKKAPPEEQENILAFCQEQLRQMEVSRQQEEYVKAKKKSSTSQ